MHVTVDVILLAKSLKNTIYIIQQCKGESRAACIYLKASNNQLTAILSNDCDKAIITIPCSTIEEGSCYVTAHRFVSLLQSFSEQVELIKGDSILQIKQGESCFNLAIFQDGIVNIDPVRFEAVHSLMISGDKLNDMISVTKPFADTSSQSVISGINIQAGHNHIEMRSCHNAAMAISKYKCRTSNKCNINVTIKSETLQAVGQLFNNETIKIEVADRLIRFVGEGCTLYTGVLYGNFPPIDRLIESDNNCIIPIRRIELDRCLRRVCIIKTLSRRLQLLVNDNKLTIAYENSLVESFSIDSTNRQLNIVIDYNYLIDILHVFSNAILTLQITSSGKLIATNDNNLVLICPLV